MAAQRSWVHVTEMAIFALKQTVNLYRNQGTCACALLMQKNAFDWVNHWRITKKLLDRNVPLHIAKLFIVWYSKQEFMVWWGNSLSIKLRCSNGIMQGGQFTIAVPTIWPKPSPPSNRCKVLCRRCQGKFTELCGWYGVTCTHGNCSSDTLGGMSSICWTSWHCIQHNENSMFAGPTKTIARSLLNKSEARKWET